MTNNNIDSFSESTIYLVLVKALSFLPLILLPLLAKSVEPEVFSQVLLAITIERFLFVIYEFGSHLPGISRISYILKNEKDHNKDKISLIFSEVKLLRIIMWVITCLIILIILNFFNLNSINRQFLFICLLSGILKALSPIWFFQAIRRLRYQFLMALFSRLLCFTGVIFLFFTNSLSGFNFLVIFLIGDLLSLCLGALFFFYNNFYITFKTIKSFKATFCESVNYFIGRFSSSSYNSISPILLGIINPLNFALYSISERIFIILQSVNAPIMDALFAHRISDSLAKFKIAVLFIFFTASLMSIIIYIFSYEIIVLLFGSNFIGAADVLRIFCFSYVVQSISSILGHPLLTLRGYGHVTNNSVTFGFLISIILLLQLFASDALSSLSIAKLLLFTETVVLIYRLIFIYKIRSKLFL